MSLASATPLRARIFTYPAADSFGAVPAPPAVPRRFLRLRWRFASRAFACVFVFTLFAAWSRTAHAAPVKLGPGQSLQITYAYENASDIRQGFYYQFSFNANVNRAELLKHLEIKPPLRELALETSDNMSFRLTGVWACPQVYTLTITPGLKDSTGGILQAPMTRQFTVSQVNTWLQIADPGKYYMPRQGKLTLALETRGYEAVSVGLKRLFPNNLPFVINQLRSNGGGGRGYYYRGRWRYQSDEEDGDEENIDGGNPTDDLSPGSFEPLSRDVTTFTLPVAFRTGEITPSSVRLSDYLKNKQGVFMVTVAARTPGTQDDPEGEVKVRQKLVLMTNLGVMAHWTPDSLVVFAHDLLSLKPAWGVKISAYSSKNQLLGSIKTDRKGIATLTGLDKELGTPTLIVAEYKDDLTFLDLRARREDAEQFEGVTEPYKDRYQAFLYADRELYRPAETAHLHWAVRQPGGDAVPGLPLTLTVLKPNGKQLLTKAVTLDEFGAGGFDLASQRAFPTGRYLAQLFIPGSGDPIGSYAFSFEDFVPSRIKGEIKLPDPLWVAGKTYHPGIDAQHLFGAPAANMRAELRLGLSRGGVEIPGCKGFTFDNDSNWQPDGISLGEVTTSKDGTATFTHQLALPAEASMPLKGNLVAHIFELGGRPISTQKAVGVFPAAELLGLAAKPGEGRQGVVADLAAVQPDGQPAARKSLKVTLEKQVWNYNVRRYYSNYESNWSPTYDEIETRDVRLEAGRGHVTFPLHGWGYFRVRVWAEGSSQYSTASFYSYDGRCELSDPKRPSLIKLVLDKDKYKVGEIAKLRVESPYNGRGVVVLQGAKWYAMQSVEIKDNRGEVTIPIRKEYFPNLWAEVTVIHEVNAGNAALNPFSSFAAAALNVQDPGRELQVTMPGLPTEMRPAGPLDVALDLRDERGKPVSGELTLAAVDEGIHLITNYENPNPLKWLMRLRRPDLHRAHYYDKISYDFDKPATGGDGDEWGDRTSAPGESWIKPVALWTGTIHTDKHGHAVAHVDVPEFTGQLRLVALGLNGQRIGVASAQLFVRRPYLLRSGVPRFALPGDQFRAVVSVFNQSKAAVTAHLTAQATGAAEINTFASDLPLAPGASADAQTTVAVAQRTGQSELRWDADIRDAAGQTIESLHEPLPIPIRPPALFQTLPAFKILPPGETYQYTNTQVIDDAVAQLHIDVSAEPLRRLQGALQYLVDYPYGCVEQTTSKLMPLYLLRKQTNLLTAACRMNDDLATTVTPERLNEMIRVGVERLFAMQTPEGGLAFWPGGSQPYYYGSVYALHCLTLIEQGREFTLPTQNVQSLRDYVRRGALMGSPPDTYTEYQRAYALFVLTIGGDARAAQAIADLDHVPLARPARLLLAAALAHATRDPERVQNYLKTASIKPNEWGWDDPTFGSQWRDKALELLTLTQIGIETKHQPDEANLNQVANDLSLWIGEHGHGNTHESALIITALAGYIDRLGADSSAAAAEITAVGGQPAPLGADHAFVAKHRGPAGAFTVRNTGKSPLFINTATKGVPLHAADKPTTCTALSIERRIYTPDGRPADPRALKHMGTYVVDLSIYSTRWLANIAVADLLPAGLEVENPRLNASAVPSKSFTNAIEPSYADLRDDRLVLAFDRLPVGQNHYYYIVQAVTPGRFTQPAATAEGMYDLTVKAATASAHITIAPRN